MTTGSIVYPEAVDKPTVPDDPETFDEHLAVVAVEEIVGYGEVFERRRECFLEKRVAELEEEDKL